MSPANGRAVAILRVALPVLVVGLAALIALAMIQAREEPQPTKAGPPARVIRVHRAQRRVVTLHVHSQGTVHPATVTTLVARVGGEVRVVSPALAAGGFFSRGETLVAIEKTDYELAIQRAKAAVARARLAQAVEERESKLAVAEWKREMGDAEPDPLAAHGPQLAAARAEVAAAEAQLRQAELDLERTTILAPYEGRVSQRFVDIAQVVVPGQRVAIVHGTTRAEVVLPIHDAELAHLALPPELGRAGAGHGPPVRLRARFGGKELAWNGRIARIEDEIDPGTHMVRLVATVQDPYARRNETAQPPLPFGLFVEAEIDGKRSAGVVVVPPGAMRAGNRVFIAEQGRLRSRSVSILKTERDRVLIGSGIADGELVCISPLEMFVEGMRVSIAETDGR